MASFYRSDSSPDMRPVDQGYKAWSVNPEMMASSLNPLTSQTVYVVRVSLPESFSCTAADYLTSNAGTTVTYARLGIHGEDRVLLATSDDQITNMQAAAGLKTAAFSATSLTGGPGRFCFISILAVSAVTMPGLSRTGAVNTASTNAGLTASNFRMSTGGTGQASLPTTPTLSSGGLIPFVGLR
jgi:hypothetical protein